MCEYASTKPTSTATKTTAPSGKAFDEYDERAITAGTPCERAANYNATPLDVDFVEFDLALMHHFATATYATLCDQSPSCLRETWQIEVPKEAFSQPFLMHSLLALAALHKTVLGDTNDDNQCLTSAVKHHNLALAKSKLALANFSKENCEALFTFSATVAIFALALPVCDNSRVLDDPVCDLAQIATLMRGSATIVRTGLHWVRDGKLEPLLRDGFLSSTCDLAADVQRQLDCLRCRIDSAGYIDHIRTPYLHAVELLTTCFRNIVPFPEDRGVVTSWLAMIPPELVSLISERQPMALVLLANYGVLLHCLKDLWWCRNWGAELVKSVSKSLEDEWQDLIEWPKQRIARD